MKILFSIPCSLSRWVDDGDFLKIWNNFQPTQEVGNKVIQKKNTDLSIYLASSLSIYLGLSQLSLILVPLTLHWVSHGSKSEPVSTTTDLGAHWMSTCLPAAVLSSLPYVSSFNFFLYEVRTYFNLHLNRWGMLKYEEVTQSNSGSINLTTTLCCFPNLIRPKETLLVPLKMQCNCF